MSVSGTFEHEAQQGIYQDAKSSSPSISDRNHYFLSVPSNCWRGEYAEGHDRKNSNCPGSMSKFRALVYPPIWYVFTLTCTSCCSRISSAPQSDMPAAVCEKQDPRFKWIPISRKLHKCEEAKYFPQKYDPNREDQGGVQGCACSVELRHILGSVACKPAREVTLNQAY